jgi:hypothetical protein
MSYRFVDSFRTGPRWNITMHGHMNVKIKVKVKVKQTHYRPGVAQRVPES